MRRKRGRFWINLTSVRTITGCGHLLRVGLILINAVIGTNAGRRRRRCLAFSFFGRTAQFPLCLDLGGNLRFAAWLGVEGAKFSN